MLRIRTFCNVSSSVRTAKRLSRASYICSVSKQVPVYHCAFFRFFFSRQISLRQLPQFFLFRSPLPTHRKLEGEKEIFVFSNFHCTVNLLGACNSTWCCWREIEIVKVKWSNYPGTYLQHPLFYSDLSMDLKFVLERPPLRGETEVLPFWLFLLSPTAPQLMNAKCGVVELVYQDQAEDCQFVSHRPASSQITILGSNFWVKYWPLQRR